MESVLNQIFTTKLRKRRVTKMCESIIPMMHGNHWKAIEVKLVTRPKEKEVKKGNEGHI